MPNLSEVKIHHVHDGVEIAYSLRDNRWHYELNGRERSADSLVKACEAIDRPEPKAKAKPFQRIKAWKLEGACSDTFVGVEVTSIAEERCGSKEVWIRDASGNRRKERASWIFPCCPHNDQLVGEIHALQKQIEDLGDQQEKLKARMQKLKID